MRPYGIANQEGAVPCIVSDVNVAKIPRSSVHSGSFLALLRPFLCFHNNSYRSPFAFPFAVRPDVT